ncbi:hypothetical protein L210DRAFT_3521765 [Boletus edulis BED1]|uniref:Fungal-type protein kinase domain-containing protein n=1 Tax=Boletus edulis BED1 TaxID=1328754 RepID=A0AAD4GKT4_BOLED|nr:hypothetical protein L210DRAFT_3521765 [Boletus edulis BED1]
MFVDWPWPCIKSSISIFQHYQLVLGTVGHTLTTFKSTKELTTTVLDELKAHAHAYQISGILHCDVSPGNIIQTKNG